MTKQKGIKYAGLFYKPKQSVADRCDAASAATPYTAGRYRVKLQGGAVFLFHPG